MTGIVVKLHRMIVTNSRLLALVVLALVLVLPTQLRGQSLDAITPAQAPINTTLGVTITGIGTNFLVGTPTMETWLEQGSTTLPMTITSQGSATDFTAEVTIPCGSPTGLYDVYYRDTDVSTTYDTLFLLDAFQVDPGPLPTFNPTSGFRGDTLAFNFTGVCPSFAPSPGQSIHRAWLDDGTHIVPLDTVIANSSSFMTGSLIVSCDLPAAPFDLFYSWEDTVSQTIDTVAFGNTITLNNHYQVTSAQVGDIVNIEFTGIGTNFIMGSNINNKAWIQRGADQVLLTSVNVLDPLTWNGTLDLPLSTAGGYWDLFYCETNTVTLDADTTETSCPFKVCLTADCDFVWPGDANNDGTVNNQDILPIGAGFGTTGPARPFTSIMWEGYANNNWPQTFPAWDNYKHADCDGDGTIDYADTLAVAQNYQLIHFKQGGRPPTTTGGAPPLVIEVQDPNDSLQVNDNIVANLRLGTNTMPSDDTYGLAFTINFPPELMDSASIYFKSEDGWLGDEGVTNMKFHKTLYHEGRVEATITRIDQVNVSGFGKIAEFGGATADNLSGKDEVEAWLTLSLSDVRLIDAAGDELPYTVLADSVFVTGDGPKLQVEPKELNVAVFPNPANTYTHLMASHNRTIDRVRIFDALGRPVRLFEPNNTNAMLDVSMLAEGTYLIEITMGDARTVKRIMIYH